MDWRSSTYLYGILRRPKVEHVTLSKLLKTGVGMPPSSVRLVPFEDLAAIASSVAADRIGESEGVRGLRRDTAAHADVLNRVLSVRTVLPGRFGIVFPDDRTLIEEFLAPQHDLLLNLLRRLKGAVELSFTADYVEARVLEEVIRTTPELGANLRGGGYHDRIDLGRRIAQAISLRRESDAPWILDRLASAAREVAVHEARSELRVLGASFLVDRSNVDRFDLGLERVQKDVGGLMTLSCVGPLPPYSFSDVRIPAAAY
jgi:hypothetical protein